MNVLRVMHADLCRIGIKMPSRIDFEEATFNHCVEWNISALEISSRQSKASATEQQKALTQDKAMVDNYKQGLSGFTKSILLMGVAGSGKMTVQECVGLYGVGQGLFVIGVSLTAKRANQIGGIHAHKLFCFNMKKYVGAGKMAEAAWIKL